MIGPDFGTQKFGVQTQGGIETNGVVDVEPHTSDSASFIFLQSMPELEESNRKINAAHIQLPKKSSNPQDSAKSEAESSNLVLDWVILGLGLGGEACHQIAEKSPLPKTAGLVCEIPGKIASYVSAREKNSDSTTPIQDSVIDMSANIAVATRAPEFVLGAQIIGQLAQFADQQIPSMKQIFKDPKLIGSAESRVLLETVKLPKRCLDYVTEVLSSSGKILCKTIYGSLREHYQGELAALMTQRETKPFDKTVDVDKFLNDVGLIQQTDDMVKGNTLSPAQGALHLLLFRGVAQEFLDDPSPAPQGTVDHSITEDYLEKSLETFQKTLVSDLQEKVGQGSVITGLVNKAKDDLPSSFKKNRKGLKVATDCLGAATLIAMRAGKTELAGFLSLGVVGVESATEFAAGVVLLADLISGVGKGSFFGPIGNIFGGILGIMSILDMDGAQKRHAQEREVVFKMHEQMLKAMFECHEQVIEGLQCLSWQIGHVEADIVRGQVHIAGMLDFQQQLIINSFLALSHEVRTTNLDISTLVAKGHRKLSNQLEQLRGSQLQVYSSLTSRHDFVQRALGSLVEGQWKQKLCQVAVSLDFPDSVYSVLFADLYTLAYEESCQMLCTGGVVDPTNCASVRIELSNYAALEAGNSIALLDKLVFGDNSRSLPNPRIWALASDLLAVLVTRRMDLGKDPGDETVIHRLEQVLEKGKVLQAFLLNLASPKTMQGLVQRCADARIALFKAIDEAVVTFEQKLNAENKARLQNIANKELSYYQALPSQITCNTELKVPDRGGVWSANEYRKDLMSGPKMERLSLGGKVNMSPRYPLMSMFDNVDQNARKLGVGDWAHYAHLHDKITRFTKDLGYPVVTDSLCLDVVTYIVLDKFFEEGFRSMENTDAFLKKWFEDYCSEETRTICRTVQSFDSFDYSDLKKKSIGSLEKQHSAMIDGIQLSLDSTNVSPDQVEYSVLRNAKSIPLVDPDTMYLPKCNKANETLYSGYLSDSDNDENPYYSGDPVISVSTNPYKYCFEQDFDSDADPMTTTFSRIKNRCTDFSEEAIHLESESETIAVFCERIGFDRFTENIEGLVEKLGFTARTYDYDSDSDSDYSPPKTDQNARIRDLGNKLVAREGSLKHEWSKSEDDLVVSSYLDHPAFTEKVIYRSKISNFFRTCHPDYGFDASVAKVWYGGRYYPYTNSSEWLANPELAKGYFALEVSELGKKRSLKPMDFAAEDPGKLEAELQRALDEAEAKCRREAWGGFKDKVQDPASPLHQKIATYEQAHSTLNAVMRMALPLEVDKKGSLAQTLSAGMGACSADEFIAVIDKLQATASPVEEIKKVLWRNQNIVDIKYKRFRRERKSLPTIESRPDVTTALCRLTELLSKLAEPREYRKDIKEMQMPMNGERDVGTQEELRDLREQNKDLIARVDRLTALVVNLFPKGQEGITTFRADMRGGRDPDENGQI